MRGCSAEHLNFNDGLIRHVDLRGAVLSGSNLRDPFNLVGSELQFADFSGLHLEALASKPNELNLSHCRFDRCVINDVRFDNFILIGAKGLWGPNKAMISPDCKGQEWAIYRYSRDYLSWEALRSIGQIRLFGVSYAAFIGLVLFSQIARAYKTWVQALLSTPEESLRHALGSRLPPLDVHWHFAVLLAAIALLSIGATVYAVRCPDIVKEYSHAKWWRELGKPFAEYASAKYSRSISRYIAGVAYGLGIFMTLGYLAWRGVLALLWFAGFG